MAADVRIDIAAEFTGKKAFKQAETSTDKLTKNVKGLAKGLLAVYSAQKLLSYAKASVKAFAEDDKAAKALGTTLKNLGLAYGANIGTVNGFISRLEMQTGVLDDELRPAMDRLLRATGDVTKSQELLGLALDIAAGTGKSVTQVSQSLQKAYLGQTQALGRLGVGLTRAELSTSTFEQIQERLAVLFAGQATAAADTYAGSLAKLTVASNNAKETIGKGLVDALITVTNSNSTDEFIAKIDKAAQSIANFVRETGEFIKITKSIFDFKNLSFFAASGGLFGDGKGFGNISMTVSSQDTQKADAIAKKNATAITKLTKEQAAAQAKILKDKRLGAAIDKANLALNKGNEVFDMDKIQIAAALTNQAEQLGKATSSAQVLQIANDTARLNVKRSILALEDAIAAKDEAAIIAATAKLNADLKVLGALTGQSAKLSDIKSILESLKPKDLINLANLDAAIAKMIELLKLQGTKTLVTTTPSGVSGTTVSGTTVSGTSSNTGNPALDSLIDLRKGTETGTGINFLLKEHIDEIIANSSSSMVDEQSQLAMMRILNRTGIGATSGFDPARFRAADNGNPININVTAGVGDPEAIARAVEDVIRQSYQRGTSATGLLAI
jgi:hypothetical protein